MSLDMSALTAIHTTRNVFQEQLPRQLLVQRQRLRLLLRPPVKLRAVLQRLRLQLAEAQLQRLLVILSQASPFMPTHTTHPRFPRPPFHLSLELWPPRLPLSRRFLHSYGCKFVIQPNIEKKLTLIIGILQLRSH